MYLGGEFGDSAHAVNPYAASSFFAVDRVASYLREWKSYLDDGGIVLLDRYTTSNAIYQASKMPEGERESFCDWLFDFEYRLLGLPEPSAVIFLDMPLEYAESLMRKREGEEDIHEQEICRLPPRQPKNNSGSGALFTQRPSISNTSL